MYIYICKYIYIYIYIYIESATLLRRRVRQSTNLNIYKCIFTCVYIYIIGGIHTAS